MASSRNRLSPYALRVAGKRHMVLPYAFAPRVAIARYWRATFPDGA